MISRRSLLIGTSLASVSSVTLASVAQSTEEQIADEIYQSFSSRMQISKKIGVSFEISSSSVYVTKDKRNNSNCSIYMSYISKPTKTKSIQFSIDDINIGDNWELGKRIANIISQKYDIRRGIDCGKYFDEVGTIYHQLTRDRKNSKPDFISTISYPKIKDSTRVCAYYKIHDNNLNKFCIMPGFECEQSIKMYPEEKAIRICHEITEKFNIPYGFITRYTFLALADQRSAEME